MSIDESIDAFRPVVSGARRRGWWSRGYVSTAFGCPYQGEVDEAAVVGVAHRLLELGVDELSIGDTIGVAAPSDVRRVVGALLEAGIGAERLAMHFHDTRGTALANVATALDLGVRCFDASTGGTGGCPYAPGAAGNLATRGPRLPPRPRGVSPRRRPRRAARGGAARQHTSSAAALGTKVGQAGGWRLP